ncbi:MAG: ATP-dependent DNA helicase, partial [Chromatiales bacterium]
MEGLDEIFGPQGPLAARVSGFSCRPQQAEMAEAVAHTLESGGALVTEAGTGTGKTFAYLVPTLLSGRKVIVSTGTRNLQDQLYHRDLPVVREALSVQVDAALLKGRANYLCLHRLDTAPDDPAARRRDVSTDLARVRDWASVTRSGDIAELSGLSERAPVWPLVTSTADNCLGQDCPAYARCHLAEARRRAQEADLVVVNHHLLCADFALRDDGFGEILPGADAFVVDEAHQLPEVASAFFGESVTGRQLLELARDAETEYRREAGDQPELPQRAAVLEKAVRELRLSFGADPRKGAWADVEGDGHIQYGLQQVREALNGLGEVLEQLAGRGRGLASCRDRSSRLAGGLTGVCEAAGEEDIRWYETYTQSFRLSRTPLEIAPVFRAHMDRHAPGWVFTSATLAVGGRFDHFQRQLGLEEARTARWESPFDYPAQALWFVPRGLPDPGSPRYVEAVVEVAVPVIEASRGRAFLLFTSHRALKRAAGLLADRLPFPLLVQGEAPKGELLERFRRAGDGVLLGTSSFWEGVDVRGEALSCVIIDKLPFASPGDPVLQARIDALRRRGGNPFMEFQVPQAAIALKQGAGRLIRGEQDRGVLVMCDPRLLSRPYGRVFLDSMPPMARTRDPEDVRRFFDAGEWEKSG